jgi:hypothetical protein
VESSTLVLTGVAPPDWEPDGEDEPDWGPEGEEESEIEIDPIVQSLESSNANYDETHGLAPAEQHTVPFGGPPTHQQPGHMDSLEEAILLVTIAATTNQQRPPAASPPAHRLPLADVAALGGSPDTFAPDE